MRAILTGIGFYEKAEEIVADIEKVEKATNLDFPDIDSASAFPRITAAHIDGFGKRPSAFITDSGYDDYLDRYDYDDIMLAGDHIGGGGDRNEGLVFDHLLNVHIPTVVKGSALLVAVLAIALIIWCCCPSCGSCIKYAAKAQKKRAAKRKEGARDAAAAQPVQPQPIAAQPQPPPAVHPPPAAPDVDFGAAAAPYGGGIRYAHSVNNCNGYSAASFPPQNARAVVAAAPAAAPAPSPKLVIDRDGTVRYVKAVYAGAAAPAGKRDKKEPWEETE